ncbi:MAG: antitoxin family protein [Candidatus Jordarchaeum sp.]
MANILRISKFIEFIYKNGIFKLLKKVRLKEGDFVKTTQI